MIDGLDIQKNRAAMKWTNREQLGRVLWFIFTPFFRYSPRILWGWRRQLLRAFGAHVGQEVHIYPTVEVAIPWNLSIDDYSAIGHRAVVYSLGKITLGKRVTISQRSHLCAGTHDISKAERPLVKSPITIDSDAWVAAEAFIGPGVRIGQWAVVGARAVVAKNVSPRSIVVGNPARAIGCVEKDIAE